MALDEIMFQLPLYYVVVTVVVTVVVKIFISSREDSRLQFNRFLRQSFAVQNILRQSLNDCLNKVIGFICRYSELVTCKTKLCYVFM